VRISWSACRCNDSNYESSKSHLSHSYLLICCFWHYWLFYFSLTSFILVWHFFYCSLFDQTLFTKPFFLCNITHLENATTNVSNWMSSNFLSLNPSKTEFLIFALPQQLSKLNNPTIHLPIIMSNSHLLILLAILVSSLIKIRHLHNVSLLFLNHVFTIHNSWPKTYS